MEQANGLVDLLGQAMGPWRPFDHSVEDRTGGQWGIAKQGDLVEPRHIEGNLEDQKVVEEIDNGHLVGTREVSEKVHGDQVQQELELGLSSPIRLAPSLFDHVQGKKGIRIDVEAKAEHRWAFCPKDHVDCHCASVHLSDFGGPIDRLQWVQAVRVETLSLGTRRRVEVEEVRRLHGKEQGSVLERRHQVEEVDLDQEDQEQYDHPFDRQAVRDHGQEIGGAIRRRLRSQEQ